VTSYQQLRLVASPGAAASARVVVGPPTLATDLHPETSYVLVADTLAALRRLPDGCVRTCVTSPPYWGLRDYGFAGQIGVEKSLADYLDRLVAVFREVRRVLAPDGTLWLNLGDGHTSGGRAYRAPDRKTDYSRTVRGLSFRPPTPPGLKPKDLLGLPWRLAFRLQEDGWYLRADIIWHKPNVLPESVKDRPTIAHEYLFLLSRSLRYHYDHQAILEPTESGREKRNRRSVWSVPTEPYPEAHFATFPQKLITPCILAGSRPGERVLDPFLGSGTTGLAALVSGRSFVGIELNSEYAGLAARRVGSVADVVEK
jgi:DNA modification methylase